MATRPKPLVLAILDGWGHRDELADNAIANAKTPVWDALVRDYPNGLINASELHVGLPVGQMGNSEVGHMNIGSGRVLMQELPKIDAAIKDGSIAKKPAFLDFVARTRQGTGVCHLLGLVSPGGVHAHQAHIAAMAQLLAKEGISVNIHAILDGRDTPPQSALEYVATLEKSLPKEASIVTVSGRYYAMDRDKRWDRVQKAYDTIALAKGEKATSAKAAIDQSYAANTNDEFVLPCVIDSFPGMQDGDSVMMANFRADRAREIMAALLDPGFREFPRSSPSPVGGGPGWGRNEEDVSNNAPLPTSPLQEEGIRFAAAMGMTEYSKELSKLMTTLFPPEPLTNIFGEVIANAGLKQLRIAETEKYAHVTFFFNGGREAPFPGEERILIPSPKVATYDEKPEMSASEITDKLVEAIEAEKFDVIVVNYANTDMVGHTGDIKAAVKAVEAVDSCLGRVVQAALAKHGALLVTADHGNAEMMFDHETEQAHTAHTLNLVPVLLISKGLQGKKLAIPEGKLGDVAPTLLAMLGLPVPLEMTGVSLLAQRDDG